MHQNPMPMLMYNASKNIEFSSPALVVGTCGFAGSSPGHFLSTGL
jgi:hypothetical protein